MTKPPTKPSDTPDAATALRLAREALEDDKMFTLPRGTPSRDADVDARRMTREPQLAAWVEWALGAVDKYGCGPDVQLAVSRYPGRGAVDAGPLSPEQMRQVAAALWRAADAADAAEAKEGK